MNISSKDIPELLSMIEDGFAPGGFKLGDPVTIYFQLGAPDWVVLEEWPSHLCPTCGYLSRP